MPDKTAILDETPTQLLETPEVETEEESEEELELVLDDLVLEEITIDGICGVY